MQNPHKMTYAFLCVLLGLSLYFKTPSQTTATPETPTAPLLNRFEQQLLLRDRIQPVNRGNFDIWLYQHKHCEGALAVIALDKNEEGAALLAHYLKRPLSEVQFIFKGQAHAAFPAFTYWLHSLNPFAPPSSLLAVTEFGPCKMIKTLNWSQI